DVVHIHGVFAHQCNLEGQVLNNVDNLTFAGVRHRVMKMEVDRLIILEITTRQRVISIKLSEHIECVNQLQNGTELLDEVTLYLLAIRDFSWRCNLSQIIYRIHKEIAVVVIRLKDNYVIRLSITKACNSLLNLIVQVAVADNIARCLLRAKKPIRARKCLDKAMAAQILIHIQCVECRGIKTRQEHVDHDDKIKLAVFHPLGQVAIVILEALVITDREIRVEERVIVLDCCRQKRLVIHTKSISAKVFAIEKALIVKDFLFPRSSREDGSDLQTLF